MAWLVPNTMKVDEIWPRSEREVVKTLVGKLSKDWVVIPKVYITHKGKNAEIDVVLVSPNRGVYFLEVKGGPVWVENGQWRTRDKDGKPADIKNPIEQVVAAKHQLVKRLMAMDFDLTDLFIRDIHCN